MSSEPHIPNAGNEAVPPPPDVAEMPAVSGRVEEGAPATTAEPTSARHPRFSTDEGALGMLQSLLVTVVIAVFVITFLVQAFQIPSQSMENTLLIGDYLLVDKVDFAPAGAWKRLLPYEEIKRGDIIVFRFPANPQQHFVKRVIAVPGDRVRLVRKKAVVNGAPASENYVVTKSPLPDRFRDNFPAMAGSAHVAGKWWSELQSRVHGGELVVPAGSYFVLGDNRDESLDSRYWGFVPRENVIGRPMVIYLSFKGLEPQEGAAADGKLGRLTYLLTHLSDVGRWDRTLRLVK